MAALGLGTGLLRFLPEAGTTSRALVAQAVAITCALSALVGVFFVAGRSIWAADLPVIDTLFGAAFFVIAVATNALTLLLDSVLLAIRRPGVLSARAFGAGALRIVGLIALVAYGAWGVFGSWVLASGLSGVAAAIRIRDRVAERSSLRRLARRAVHVPCGPLLHQELRDRPCRDRTDRADPLMVLNLIGPASTAFYVVGALAGGVATGMAQAATTSLFAEGSHDPSQLAVMSRRALTFAMALLLITVCAFMFAEPVLAIFGDGYAAEGAWNLRLQVLSVLPSTFVMAFLVVLRVRERLGLVFGITFAGSVVTALLASVLVARWGVSGGGAAILVGQTTMP